MTWNAEGKLSKLSAQSGDTNYIYDADGNLLLRKSPKKTTLFVGSQEITVDTTSGTKVVSAQRHYSIGGKDVAVRSTINKIDWLVSDNHNTSQVTVDDSTHQATARYNTPFGAPRGPSAASWPDAHGFLGKPEDKDTGLTHVGAREYDPTLGRFLSVDPVIDLADPQSLLAYAYANNNPTTFSDPTGLCALDEGETRCGSHPTPVPPSSGGKKDNPKPASAEDSNQSSSSDQSQSGSSDSDDYQQESSAEEPVARPHPDRMFEMAGCYGGPGCVMPEGFPGKYGPYRPIPGEEFMPDILFGIVTLFIPGGEIAMVGRAGSLLKVGVRAPRAVSTGEKLLWTSWKSYPKVVADGQQYAKIGGRLYSKHAVDRLQPSGLRYSPRPGPGEGGSTGGMPQIYQAGGDYGRSVSPSYVEDVIRRTEGITQDNGNILHDGGGLEVILSKEGRVVTVMTK